MEAHPPKVFDYLDFRKYLQAFYDYEKSRNPRFSHRFITVKVGATSSGWFSDLIKGRIRLSTTHFSNLVKFLGLGDKETDYFEVLVAFTQAGSNQEKLRYFDKMLSFREVQWDLLGKEKFEFYSNWYYAAVREILFYLDFTDDYKQLASTLRPSITEHQARNAIRTLEKLHLIQKNGDGYYKPTSSNIKKDPDIKTVLLMRYHLKNLELAGEALKGFSKEVRDISAITVGLTVQGFQKATQEVQALRKKLLALEKSGEGPRRIYQSNFQIFPVTEEM